MNRLPLLSAFVALLLAAGACREAGAGRFGDADAADRAAEIEAMPRPAPPPAPERGVAEFEASSGAGTDESAATELRLPERAQATAQDSVVPSMIIRTGRARVEVDSLEVALAQVEALAERFGGYVANSSIQAGDERLRQGTLELKIPAARFDDAVADLDAIGEVEEVTVDAQDVGEEFVDVTARLDNARRLEERLLELLAERTGELDDVLMVERELARVRERIERYQGRLRYLESRVAVSTLSVNVHEPPPLIGDRPGTNVIGDAFRQAWRNFVGVIAWFIASLGVIVPAVIGLGIVGVLARKLYQRRRRQIRNVESTSDLG